MYKNLNERRKQYGLPPIDQVTTEMIDILKRFNIQPMQLHEQRQVIDIDCEIIEDEDDD